eukprot:GHVP01031824.1.p1 GENE.GHVP01031824.1~~GHVP01031824.1.p1  ORF type:complete len:176 (+),score=34.14 GHVP01031824.1:137-664(+)
MFSYGRNKRSKCPSKITVVGGKNKLLSKLKENIGLESWIGFELCCESSLAEKLKEQVQDRKDIVYLSPDASEIATEDALRTSHVIIGCMADRNAKKFTTLERSKEMGVPCMKFPVREALDNNHLRITGPPVFTVDQTFAIVTSVREGHDLEKSIIEIIPKRKIIPQAPAPHNPLI